MPLVTRVTIKGLQEHYTQAPICINSSKINQTKTKLLIVHTNNQTWAWATDSQLNSSNLRQEWEWQLELATRQLEMLVQESQ